MNNCINLFDLFFFVLRIDDSLLLQKDAISQTSERGEKEAQKEVQKKSLLFLCSSLPKLGVQMMQVQIVGSRFQFLIGTNWERIETLRFKEGEKYTK